MPAARRLSRRRLLVLALAPTLLLGLVVAVLVVVDARTAAAEVREADAAATAFDAEAAAYREGLVAGLADVDAEDPADVAEVVTARATTPPRPADVPARGRDGSATYRAAEKESVALAEAVERLRGVVRSAVEARTFVLAADEALDVQPQDLVPSGAVASGAPVRQQLIPPLREALETFGEVPAPRAAADAREAVQSALTYVIDQAEQLAASLDAGRGGSFGYARQYADAREAVRQYADGVRADLAEAIDGVVGTDDPEEPAEPA